MSDIMVRLKNFDKESAEKTAEAIREAGGIRYTDSSGDDHNITVSDVTVVGGDVNIESE